MVSSCYVWRGVPAYLAHTGTAAGGLSGRYRRHTWLFVLCKVVSRLLLKPCLHRRQGTLCRAGWEEGHVALIVAGSLILAEDARWGSMVPQTSTPPAASLKGRTVRVFQPHMEASERFSRVLLVQCSGLLFKNDDVHWICLSGNSFHLQAQLVMASVGTLSV